MKHFLIFFISFYTICAFSILTSSANSVLSQANDHFTVALLQNLECQQNKENILFSPLSIGSALMMLLAGAQNLTYTQLYDSLGLNISHLTTTTLLAEFANLTDQINKAHNSNLSLALGSAIAIQKNFALNENFINNVTDTFATQVFVEDFATNASQSTGQVDQWASDGTEGGVERLFDQKMPSNTGLSLLNYLYLKGVWKTPFTVDTKNKTLLTGTSTFNYIQQAAWGQLVEIPLDSSSSLYIFLPSVNYTGSSISSLLTTGILESAINSLKPETMTVTLPQFNFTNSLDLKTLLSKLGVNDAFTRNANFFGVNGDYNLRLSQMMVSKAAISLTENGVESSAASGLILAPPGKEYTSEKKYKISVMELPLLISAQNFTVNRPFLFFFREKSTQMILFSGVIKHF